MTRLNEAKEARVPRAVARQFGWEGALRRLKCS
jgi:hypothetical protein